MNKFKNHHLTVFPDKDGKLPGILLRDYFAAKAMQGIISASDVIYPDGLQELAENSYKIADTMIKARES